MAEFDVKRVTTLEWAGIGAGLAAFIFSLLPWYSIDVAGFGGGSLSAWNSGFIAWFPMLLVLVAGGLVLAARFGVKVDRLPLIWLILSGLAVLLVLLRWVTLPDDGGLGDFGGGGVGVDIDSGAGAGLILGLIAAIVSAVAAALTFRAAPKRVGGANTSAI